MKRNRNWEREISRLISGLTTEEVARRLQVDYQIARRIMKEYGYRGEDGRRYGQHKARKLVPQEADWSRSNIEIARQFGVSRERVRRVRWTLGKPRVESRGRKSRRKK